MSNILRLPALDISTGQDPEGSQSRKRRLRFLATALLAIAMIAAGAFLILNRNASVAEIPRPAAAVTITDAVPRRQLWPVALETSGPIHPWQEASIGAQLGGYRLVEVLVNVGDAVRKGQVLARFDPDLLLAEEAQLKARFEQADANWQRSATLKVRGVVSDKELLYETEVKSAEASLTSKQLQLRYTEVTAPDDGTISFRTATLGTVVPVGQELFRLIRANRLEWRGEFTASQLVRVAPGQLVSLSLPGGNSAMATVRQIAPSLDPQSRLGIVYADIEAGSAARAGMYAKGKVLLGASTALVVPAESVVIRDGRSYVFVLTNPGAESRVRLRAVTVGRREGEDVEITAGITDNERLAAKGAGLLDEGDVVRIAPASALARTGADRQ
ncbi:MULTISPECIES: efflux RND transporter periplasmic adaptor subunit [Bradyrhizobium]|jgi:RND family efflux transporter MFP subunit|uniref:efflux RND transporter periplasmic adaptor subunit n=2 Tax=Nitrobacteraceae TaxID=41294 RepID=UPI0020236399|nr:efflux RND transporter periplasmic adaptor subunit [Bradyrhizobium denitrificans]MCL8482874.1 efflux RND transporter periplasmic adaptor subunit [Bradyrhizobium denitrificans]